MYDSALPSDVAAPSADVSAIRADGTLRLSLATVEGTTYAADVFEAGGLRARFPRGSRCETVLINTGGGIVGGDRLRFDISAAADTDTTLTTQAAERIYRSDGATAIVDVALRLADGARLDWLPQETMLYDGGAATRRLDVEMRATARLTILESLVVGREAHGETIAHAAWRDRWRIRRDGRLVFAEAVDLSGPISEMMERACIGGGARAIATLLHVAPDAARHLEPLRRRVEDLPAHAVASTWNDILVVRMAATSAKDIRTTAAAAATTITERPMPRTWMC